jgi:hypothetical protein
LNFEGDLLSVEIFLGHYVRLLEMLCVCSTYTHLLLEFHSGPFQQFCFIRDSFKEMIFENKCISSHPLWDVLPYSNSLYVEELISG